jgi:hemoglobin/transferrin/lactoferrin receptor protein
MADFPGYSGAQPPGVSQSTALILDHSLSWGPVTLTTGSRWDRQRAEAKGGTAYVMNRAGAASSIAFSQSSPSVALTLRALNDITATVRRSRAFRPPLIDEYFTNNGYCNTDPDLYELSGETGICGGLYSPEVAYQTEWTLAWASSERLWGGRFQARATFFRITTSHVLESIQSINGRAEQPGTEYRNGHELEASYDHPAWFANVSVSRVGARQEDGGPNAPAVFDLPGSLTSATVGTRWLDNKIEAGLRWRSQGDRTTLSGAQVRPECGRLTGQVLPNQRLVAIQYGPDVLDLFASWRLYDRTVLRVSVDNVTDEAYCTLSGFLGGIGLPAAGRSARMSLSVQM